jgi:hypothetical protein
MVNRHCKTNLGDPTKPGNYRPITDQVFQQSVGIPMGTNCAPLLADLFLCSFEVEFVQRLLRDGDKGLAVAFSHTFGCIDDVMSIGNHGFHNCVHLVCPDGLGMRDTAESDRSASFLDVLLGIDSIAD